MHFNRRFTRHDTVAQCSKIQTFLVQPYICAVKVSVPRALTACQHLTFPELMRAVETLETYFHAKLIVTFRYFYLWGLFSSWLWKCLKLWKYWRLYSKQQPLLLKYIPAPLMVLDLPICSAVFDHLLASLPRDMKCFKSCQFVWNLLLPDC